jgi:hypothetical protein
VLGLKDQVFGDAGFSADLKLEKEELDLFRHYINAHFLSVIRTHYPALSTYSEKMGIENYHLFSDQVDHQKLWSKTNRVLPKEFVHHLKQLSFIKTLKEEFGDFLLSDIYDVKQHYGHEEVYWRIVRPQAKKDVGSLHKDKWFHGAFNSGYGMYKEDEVTVKVWIPIFCEKGKSGLAIAKGSHLREWKYHTEMHNGFVCPIPDEDLSDANAALIPTEAGNILLFNEGILHGGVMNAGEKTRVSAEITMVMQVDHQKGITKF